ncbi:hypothetical protein B0H16DRAFT_1471855 [Mycena metata]|uniref:Uncharacterized protein n=1 Tax=Mycena metata TaxID=1033252 RepID=A0AAD7HQE9_9AGAR|nr:hypothetical protein B0H16DRAFT_1471855 [Mycena metata]
MSEYVFPESRLLGVLPRSRTLGMDISHIITLPPYVSNGTLVFGVAPNEETRQILRTAFEPRPGEGTAVSLNSRQHGRRVGRRHKIGDCSVPNLSDEFRNSVSASTFFKYFGHQQACRAPEAQGSVSTRVEGVATCRGTTLRRQHKAAPTTITIYITVPRAGFWFGPPVGMQVSKGKAPCLCLDYTSLEPAAPLWAPADDYYTHRERLVGALSLLILNFI